MVDAWVRLTEEAKAMDGAILDLPDFTEYLDSVRIYLWTHFRDAIDISAKLADSAVTWELLTAPPTLESFAYFQQVSSHVACRPTHGPQTTCIEIAQ